MTMHTKPTPGLKGWVKQHKSAAIARGGRPFTAAEVIAESVRHKAGCSRPILARGEIVNSITGEIVTGCLSLSKALDVLRERYGIDTTVRKLIPLLERKGLVERRIAWRMVPMVIVPAAMKPEYRYDAVATGAATGDGLLITIHYGPKDENWVRTLVTPDGLALFALLLKAPAGTIKKSKARDTVRAMVAEGRTQAEIVRLTGMSKQAVSYHTKSISNI
ncbi:MAG: hypothetical protein EOQ86_00935 [Mesorhizobium sp.]|uniref:hypothetical protein n=1 Tax=Mesorhizobium sp. TaxID=1871066 RepID=UPI000FEA7422|nr:hypothetical protein [Mesorhizobium sp.]RWH84355.1 MAG: hypothetical protein EOQ85_01915 [Mesorhizobium sp.]RWH86741.1 MAG: hypothetical protein EOQ86_00935 [Mesorhizobium sp.]RWH93721.1 MAG: hypothetical protein EOQ87_04195 [Mesorhizobium sp.]RWI02822.1 MAG: hypothetical protein EOQ88_00935 [Mesorhizobium sp.]RWI05332.1 MAG: hypothetical protein EOQ89_04980 [Mesorhizobium sp.]